MAGGSNGNIKYNKIAGAISNNSNAVDISQPRGYVSGGVAGQYAETDGGLNMPLRNSSNNRAYAPIVMGTANDEDLIFSRYNLPTSDPSSDGSSILWYYNTNLDYWYSEFVGIGAFSPLDIAMTNTQTATATTQYYYQTISGVTKTVSSMKVWGTAGSETVLVGLYRGTLSGTLTLIGQGSAVCGIGENIITLSPEVGENLHLASGESLVVGLYPSGTSWRSASHSGLSNAAFGISNTADITTMPTVPSGTASDVRFACTIY